MYGACGIGRINARARLDFSYLVLLPPFVAVPAVADPLAERRQAELFSVATYTVLFGCEGHPARIAAVI